MKRLIFASNNPGKIREIRLILEEYPVEICSLKDLNLVPEAEETGETFAENARIKAQDAYEQLKKRGEILSDTVVLADDSGLCIDYFDGAPGVKSARYLGYDTPYSEKNRIILDKMKNVPLKERGASFVCHMTAIAGDGRSFDAESRMEGAIACQAEGQEGFGYDPIFYVPEYDRVSGLLTPEEKASVSHRGKVLRLMRDILVKEGLI